jgi:Tfp pilus assembly protein PilN
MQKNIISSILITIILGSTSLSAQEQQEPATLDQGPISGQFDYAIEKSSKYEEYRVVRSNWLYKLKSNVIDSLTLLQSRIETGQSEIDSLNNQIKTINQNLKTTKEKRDDALNAKNSISFLGAEMPKGQYNTLMWGLVVILAVALALVFLLFKRSHHLTTQMRERHNELEKEFDAHRKRALEKEKVMARQHLNELNKIKGRD